MKDSSFENLFDCRIDFSRYFGYSLKINWDIYQMLFQPWP